METETENPNTICSNISDWRPRSENDKMENEDGEIRSVDKAVASCPGLSASTSALREDVVDERRRTRAFKRDMLEVFSERYMNINGQNPGRLYGEIRFLEALWSYHHLYNRDRKHSESIDRGDTILMNGPALPISVPDYFDIDAGLIYEYEYDNRLLGDEIISGQIYWNMFSCEYDTPLFEVVKGLFGWVIVNYVVFSCVVDATVEVIFIKGDKAKLYGLLNACNSDFTDESSASVLFRKSSDEGIDVKHGQPIPLSRSSVAVPWNSSLIIQANLFDSLYDDDIIFEGTVEFPTQPPSTSEKNIFGKYGEIKVNVIWDNY